MAGLPAQRTRGLTDYLLYFTTNEAALKSDPWLLQPSREKSRLLPTMLAGPTTCQEGGGVAEGAATISAMDPLTSV